MSKHNNAGKRIPTGLFVMLMIVLVGIFLLSAYMLVDYMLEQNKASSSYTELSTVITRRPENNGNSEEQAEEGGLPIEADHETLSVMNPNYAFWLHIEDTVISYPVVANVGNSYYLNHLFTGEKNANGTLFADESCEEPLTAGMNTLVHGHRMNSGNMFGSLHNYLDAEYAINHREIYVLSPKGDYVGRIFAAYKAKVGGDYTTINFKDEEARAEYIAEHVEKSEVNFGAFPNSNAPILTLATCVKHNDSQRMIVMMTLEEIE